MNASGMKTDSAGSDVQGSTRATPPLRYYVLIGAFLLLLVLLGTGSALADPVPPAPGSPAAEAQILNGLLDAIESGNPEESEADVAAVQTDLEAAEELPHHELDRAEALELMRRVFGLQLQAPAGIFDELDVERFLSNYAAVTPAESQPAPSGVVVGGSEAPPQDAHATLLESSVPLRAPNDLGSEQPVDLGLEHAEGELQPANPLVEVGIPQELGEGIELPEAGVLIELVDAPQERTPSTLDQSVAAYPEVANDTSLAVPPTATGVETMTLLQSADAPHSESFRLDLPEGATLQQSEGGGAEVLSGDEAVLVVEPPTATDAEGQSVPVSLEVSGDTLVLQVSPGPEASFPILVDPVYDTFNWNGVTTTSGTWFAVGYNNSPFGTSTAATCSNTAGAANQCGTPLTQNTPGLYVYANSGATASTGSWTQRNYFVPRAGSDYNAYGTLPSSFIESMTINHIGFWHRSDPAASPFLGAGIWAGPEAPVWGANPAGWASLLTWGGNQGDINETLQFTFPGNNNHNAKEALVGMVATEPHTMTAYRDSLFREVTISLGDVDKPGFAPFTPPSGWADQTSSPIGFTATDTGLGVSSLSTSDRQTPQHTWTTSAGCLGTNDSPCPHTWKSTDAGRPPLKYDPSVLPTGVDTLDVKALDPLGNTSTTGSVPVKVDHLAPNVNLTGTMTEQATRGPSRPRYTLKVGATDGSEASPQSGVASVKISVDGKQVQLVQPGCATQNCQVATEWTLNSLSYAVGSHTVAATATDAVGRSATKELVIQIQRDTTKPIYSLLGEFAEAPDSWVNQRNYSVTINGSDGSGYGVTKEEILVDGKVAKGGTAEQSCPDGACSFNKTFTINMANYSGGEHTGTIVVTDGAGNKAELSNPFRVNPSGNISAAEATKTIKAAEVTSGEAILVPSAGGESPPAETPGLVANGSNIQTIGTFVTSKMGTNQAAPVMIEAPGGTVQFALTGVAGTATPIEIEAGSAGVSANTSAGADTAIRPIFDGVFSFAAIRNATAPEEYSWSVELPDGQTLYEETDQVAEVYYKDGTQAMAIVAVPAHDATGAEVPTSLKVSNGNVLTLTVHHRPLQGQPSYVYPVVAGAKYETGYETPVITVATEAKEEEEAALKLAEEELFRAEQEQLEHEIEVLEEEIEALELKIAEAGGWEEYSAISPPELVEGDDSEASASGLGGQPVKRHFLHVECSHTKGFSELYREYEDSCGNPFQGKPGVAVAFRAAMHGKFFQKEGSKHSDFEVWHEGSATDSIGCVAEGTHDPFPSRQRRAHVDNCVWWGATSGGGGARATWGYHITPVARATGENRGSCGDECGRPNPWESFSFPPMAFYLWANGHYKFHQTDCIDC